MGRTRVLSPTHPARPPYVKTRRRDRILRWAKEVKGIIPGCGGYWMNVREEGRQGFPRHQIIPYGYMPIVVSILLVKFTGDPIRCLALRAGASSWRASSATRTVR